MSSTPAANGHATRLPDIGPDVADDAAWSAAARISLGHTDARLDKRFDQDDGMDRILALRARAADHLLKDAWLRCIPAEAPMALFAVPPGGASLVPVAIQDTDHQVGHLALLGPRQIAQIHMHRRLDIHHPVRQPLFPAELGYALSASFKEP